MSKFLAPDHRVVAAHHTVGIDGLGHGPHPATGGQQGRVWDQAAAPADAAPTGADTVFTFSGEVPTGWTAEGKVLAHQAVLVVGDGSGAVSLLCTPMQAAGGPVTATVTRAFVVPEGESDTWSRVEARVFGPDKKPIAGASPQLLSAIKVGTTMSAAPYTFTPPAGASTWRLCLKTGGAARGSTVVKEIRIR